LRTWLPSRIVGGVRNLIGLGAFMVAGCGPAPYTIGPEEPSAAQPSCASHVVEEPTLATQEPEDRWVPDGLPRLNPFEQHPTWVGEYDCPQGRTRLALRVLRAQGKHVRAVFDFRHAPTDVSGKFLLAGTFDEHTGDVALAPVRWLQHPEGYEWVGMVGRVSLEGRDFVGHIAHPTCGAFKLSAAE
jgi:hypothetical protein